MDPTHSIIKKLHCTGMFKKQNTDIFTPHLLYIFLLQLCANLAMNKYV